MFTRLLAVLTLAGALGGCATLKNVVIPTTPYMAAFCANGAVPVPCINLGKVNVPDSGATFVELALQLAGPLLAQRANLKTCLFTAYPAVVDKVVMVTATAACKLNGAPVSEEVSITLAPVPS